MGDVDKITEKIAAGFKGEIDAIKKEAKSKAKEITSEAENKAEELKAGIVEAGKRDAEREKQRIVANAKLQARKIRLDAKEDVIKEAFKAAEDRLKKISSSEGYSSVLASLIKEAQAVVRGDVEIIVRKDDSKVLTPAYITKLSIDTKSKIEISSATVDTIGGAIVKAKDGKTEVNNTIEMRMERMRGDIRPRVAKALFAEG
jgi:V/A-type H+-transporting ATPase subunit E